MNRNRQMLVVAFLLSGLLLVPWKGNALENKQCVKLNGNAIDLQQPLLMVGDHVFVTLEDLGAILGIKIEKDTDLSNTFLLLGDRPALVLTVNKPTVYYRIRGDIYDQLSRLRLPARPRQEGDYVYAPLIFLAEQFGYQGIRGVDGACVELTRVDAEIADSESSLKISYEIIPMAELAVDEELYSWVKENQKGRGFYSKVIGSDTFILLCAGMRPTGGYFIEINSLELDDTRTLTIFAEIHSPGLHDMVTMAFTYPYLLLKFPEQSFDSFKVQLED